MLRINKTGHRVAALRAEKPRQQCIFEQLFRAPGQLVSARGRAKPRDAGRLCAKNTVPADIVVPVPDSGVPAALGYARVRRTFRMGLIRIITWGAPSSSRSRPFATLE